MSGFLDRMKVSSTSRLESARARLSLDEQRKRGADRVLKPFPVTSFALIAEVKPVSPAEGDLGLVSPLQLALSYEMGGASVISVLTEPTEFGGSLMTLDEVSSAVEVPVLRKDFIVDSYQVWEARAHGADGVLAIARMVDRATLQSLVEAAQNAGMFVVLEAFDEPDLEVIVSLVDADPSLVVGINCRDLTTLEIRAQAHTDLAAAVPSGYTTIAESGISTTEQVRNLVSVGYDGVLIGTTLVRADDATSLIREMLDAARVNA